MKTRLCSLLILFVGLTLLLSGSSEPIAAQEPGIPEPLLRESHLLPEGPRAQWQETLNAPWIASGGQHPVELAGITPQDTGGPDEFGYTWDNSVPLGWIDATNGQDTDMSGSSYGQAVGPISLPFPFKFYENEYDGVYIAASGFLAFSDQGYWPSQQNPFPSISPPNNVIAPFWTVMHLKSSGPAGRVYYRSGGTDPNRFFVVEWFDVAGGTAADSSGGDELYRFEVILHENGDIVYQYHTMIYNDWRYYASIGIEDRMGFDGLGYMDWNSYWSRLPSSGTAIRFYRPAPSARISVWPLYQGLFTHAGGLASFRIPVHNIGDLGADTYDLTTASTWPVSLYAANGTTLLTDTDSDGTVDTGPVAQGDTFTVVAKVAAPAFANMGDHDTATITARSSLDTGAMKAMTLQTAIPAPFAQVYQDYADGAMSLYLAQPNTQVLKKTTPDWHNGYDMAVAEMLTSFAYFWYRTRNEGDVYVGEIEYTLLDSYGNAMRGVTKLTDHSGATMNSYDWDPAVAVAPNGRIGVLWQRYLWNNATSQFNSNIYLAILDASGNLVHGPLNLTNNAVWGSWSDYNIPSFEDPRIAATDDNRFVLAWQQETNTAAGYVDDIYYAVRNTSAAIVKPITQFTADTPGWDQAYNAPNLAQLSGNRALLVWQQSNDGNIYYAVLDSGGNTVKAATNLSTTSNGSWDPDAVELSNGYSVIAWSAWQGDFMRIAYAVLDTSYNRIAGPTVLDHPAATTGGSYVSLAADPSGHAILTWLDADWYYRFNLYYALVDHSGNVLTGPTIFRTSQSVNQRFETSYEGYGNTSYSLAMPTSDDVDARVTAPAMAGGPPGGTAIAHTPVANYGLATATSVELTAELDIGLSYVQASPEPSSVSGGTVTWNLPDLDFLGQGQVVLYTTVPSVPIGTSFPITWTVTSAGPEANPGDNTAITNVVASHELFLPLIVRSD